MYGSGDTRGTARGHLSRARDRRQPARTPRGRLAASWRAPLDGKRELPARPPRVVFEAAALGKWDSSLVGSLARILNACRTQQVTADRTGLPTGVQRLLALTEAVPEKKGARREASRAALLDRIGGATVRAAEEAAGLLSVLGAATGAVGRLLRGRAAFRSSDLLLIIQRSGADALGIVSLISFL